MGGGTSHRPEVKRGSPVLIDGSRPEGLGDGGSPGSSPDFCELSHKVRFEVLDSAQVHVGQEVRLLAQHLPQVMAGSDSVGFVPEPDATAMRNCLLADFEMAGQVSAYDPRAGNGELTIKGSAAGG